MIDRAWFYKASNSTSTFHMFGDSISNEILYIELNHKNVILDSQLYQSYDDAENCLTSVNFPWSKFLSIPQPAKFYKNELIELIDDEWEKLGSFTDFEKTS